MEKGHLIFTVVDDQGVEIGAIWLSPDSEGKASLLLQGQYFEGLRVVPQTLPQTKKVCEVADRFLRRKATIGELRAAVKATKEKTEVEKILRLASEEGVSIPNIRKGWKKEFSPSSIDKASAIIDAECQEEVRRGKQSSPDLKIEGPGDGRESPT